MTIKPTTFIHLPRVSLARFSFCWCRHNWLLMTSHWPDNYDAISWIVISNSLDIDFIHGDIQGQSCKTFVYVFVYVWATEFPSIPTLFDAQKNIIYWLTCPTKEGSVIVSVPSCVVLCNDLSNRGPFAAVLALSLMLLCLWDRYNVYCTQWAR